MSEQADNPTQVSVAQPANNSADSGTLARIAVQRSKLRTAVKNLTAERDTFKAERDKLVGENEKLKVSGASQRRVRELEGQINVMKHRQVFDKMAKEKGIREDAVEAAWKLSGYTPDGDPVEDEIGEFVEGIIEQNAFLTAAATPPPVDPKATPKPGAGGGQGRPAPKPYGKNNPNPDIIPAGDPRWTDAAWQAANQPALIAHAKAKLESLSGMP